MSVYLKLGDTDVSRFIVENEYCVSTAPVYDEESEFVNIYGERIKTLLGRETEITVTLRDLPDDTALSIAHIPQTRSVSVTYSSPAQQSGDFEPLSFSLSLDREVKGVKYWTAQMKLSAYVKEVGL